MTETSQGSKNEGGLLPPTGTGNASPYSGPAHAIGTARARRTTGISDGVQYDASVPYSPASHASMPYASTPYVPAPFRSKPTVAAITADIPAVRDVVASQPTESAVESANEDELATGEGEELPWIDAFAVSEATDEVGGNGEVDGAELVESEAATGFELGSEFESSSEVTLASFDAGSDEYMDILPVAKDDILRVSGRSWAIAKEDDAAVANGKGTDAGPASAGGRLIAADQGLIAGPSFGAEAGSGAGAGADEAGSHSDAEESEDRGSDVNYGYTYEEFGVGRGESDIEGTDHSAAAGTSSGTGAGAGSGAGAESIVIERAAMILEGIAFRVRRGGLVLNGVNASLGDSAILAAVLAAILKGEGGREE